MLLHTSTPLLSFKYRLCLAIILRLQKFLGATPLAGLSAILLIQDIPGVLNYKNKWSLRLSK